MDAIRNNRIRITDPADEEAQAHHLSFVEIFFSDLQGEITEDHPADKPYLSCLNYRDNFIGQPILSVGLCATSKPELRCRQSIYGA